MGTTKSIKSLETSRKVWQIAKDYYREASEAKREGKLVAWCMRGVPLELIRSFDVVTVYPENYGTVCSAKQASRPFIEAAEADGFSGDLCSYATTVIGYVSQVKRGRDWLEAPANGLPAPDMFITTAQGCDARIKWFQALLRQYFPGLPMLVMGSQTPRCNTEDEEPGSHYVEYYYSQLLRLVAFLEQQTGRKLDMRRVREIADLSRQCYQLWSEVTELRKVVPSPMGAADHFTCMFPEHYLTGTRQAVEFYQNLASEVRERVRQSVGVLPNERSPLPERYRLLWVGIPPWYNMGLLNEFEKYGAVIAIETMYYGGRPVLLNPERPLESLAQKYVVSLGRGNDYQLALTRRLIREYQIEGVVVQTNRSCRATSLGQTHILNVLREEIPLPTLYLDSDMADGRNYAEAQTADRIQAFMESLG